MKATLPVLALCVALSTATPTLDTRYVVHPPSDMAGSRRIGHHSISSRLALPAKKLAEAVDKIKDVKRSLSNSFLGFPLFLEEPPIKSDDQVTTLNHADMRDSVEDHVIDDSADAGDDDNNDDDDDTDVVDTSDDNFANNDDADNSDEVVDDQGANTVKSCSGNRYRSNVFSGNVFGADSEAQSDEDNDDGCEAGVDDDDIIQADPHPQSGIFSTHIGIPLFHHGVQIM